MNNSKNKYVQQKLTNTIMKHGNKKKVEKFLTKSIKLIQKSNKKNYKNIIKKSIINLTPTFKIGKQTKKRGKRKLNIYIPVFIKKNSLRTILAINILVDSLKNKKSSNLLHKKITDEILESFFYIGRAIEKKNEIQKQVLMQKRYLLNFRW